MTTTKTHTTNYDVRFLKDLPLRFIAKVISLSSDKNIGMIINTDKNDTFDFQDPSPVIIDFIYDKFKLAGLEIERLPNQPLDVLFFPIQNSYFNVLVDYEGIPDVDILIVPDDFDSYRLDTCKSEIVFTQGGCVLKVT